MEKSDEILEELARISQQLAACIEKLVRVRHVMVGTVICGICQQRVADSICQCGLNLCTICEIEHAHPKLSP